MNREGIKEVKTGIESLTTQYRDREPHDSVLVTYVCIYVVVYICMYVPMYVSSGEP